jgi:pimeloyl-ACP methyl ester carboxylesterase
MAADLVRVATGHAGAGRALHGGRRRLARCRLLGPAAGYDADTIAAELREVVRPLAPDAPITVIEHDWGAVFAYCYAAQYSDEVATLGIFEMALSGLGLMGQAFVPKAGGNFLWHLPFQSVPDIPALLIGGHEPEYLQWFFRKEMLGWKVTC